MSFSALLVLAFVLGVPTAGVVAWGALATTSRTAARPALARLAAWRGLSPRSRWEQAVYGNVDQLALRVEARRGVLIERDRLVLLVDLRKLQVASRTSFRVFSTERGGIARGLDGLRVRTGDPELDALVALTSPDADITRGVVLRAEVRAALLELYESAEVRNLAVHPLGNLEVEVVARTADDEEPADLVDNIITLARALETCAHTPPQPVVGRAALGGSSGLPIGVPAAG